MNVEVPALNVRFVPVNVKIAPLIATPYVIVDEPKLIARVSVPEDEKMPQDTL